MRNRLALALVAIVLATTATLASPASTLAAAEVVETGVTTYRVNTAKAEIDVTVQLSITNNKPPSSCGSGCTTKYYWNTTYAYAEIEATNIKITSNAGRVQAKTTKTTNYYREMLVTFPNVYYRQTRVVTVTYAIPAAPRAKGGFRATKAYAELCALGNGEDSGTVNVVIPSGFQVDFYSGSNLALASESGGFQTFTSGTVATPYKFWSCLDAENAANLSTTKVTLGDQSFNIQAWPEDKKWATTVAADVQTDVPKLEELTGLRMPGGTINIQEAGNSQLGGEYVGGYEPTTSTATIVESTDDATVAHELSHIWFNKALFAHVWADEGLAGFSEQVAGKGKYEPCTDPGGRPAYAALSSWKYLDINATADDEKIVEWQYAASCYLWTEIAEVVGPTKFKAILTAAANDEIAYVGAGTPEKSPDGLTAVDDERLLDLIDERGMVPAGVTDLDRTQTWFSQYGVIVSGDLEGRSTARATYHSLAISAGTWKLPYAIRMPMALWKFDDAVTAMDTASQILALRDKIQKAVADVNLDGTALQSGFEGARSEDDLDAALALAKKEADAADKVAQAIELNGQSRGILEAIGLLGSDPSSLVAKAIDDLKQLKPDDAGATAQQAIDMLDDASGQGILRASGALGGLLALLAAIGLLVFLRRRRNRVPASAAFGAAPPDPSLSAGVWLPPSTPPPAIWSGPAQGLGSGQPIRTGPGSEAPGSVPTPPPAGGPGAAGPGSVPQPPDAPPPPPSEQG